MDAVFTLPYSEHAVAERLGQLLSKKEGYSVATPLSRQNKGWDLLVYRGGRGATIQVKSSRTYQGRPSKTSRAKKKRYQHYLWFNRFDPQAYAADFFILFGLYAAPERKKLDRSKPRRWWEHVMLLFTQSEMSALLGDSTDRFFDMGFDADPRPRHIFLLRGAIKRDDQCYEKFVLEKRIVDLRAFLNGEAINNKEPEHHLVDGGSSTTEGSQ